jgi:YVTN family beta-propeller protein
VEGLQHRPDSEVLIGPDFRPFYPKDQGKDLGVTISPDGRWVYVTAETSNTVSVLDTATNEVAATFMVGPRPRDSAFSPDGRRAYVTTEFGRTAEVVDTSTHTVVRTIRVPGAGDVKPMGVVVSPDGGRLYVATGRADGVVVIDAESYEILATVPAGRRVWGLGLTPDGKKTLRGRRPLERRDGDRHRDPHGPQNHPGGRRAVGRRRRALSRASVCRREASARAIGSSSLCSLCLLCVLRVDRPLINTEDTEEAQSNCVRCQVEAAACARHS